MYDVVRWDVTESELVIAAQGGDREALDHLLRVHYDRIYSICRRIAGNDADAADATQQALMAIVRSLNKFENRSSFSTWCYRIATNACLDELRRRKRRPIPATAQDPSTSTIEVWDRGPSTDLSDFESRIADRDLIERALAKLTDEFKIAVVLRDYLGMDYEEISRTLDIPVGTVRSRIARGRAKLAQLIGTGNQIVYSDRPKPTL